MVIFKTLYEWTRPVYVRPVVWKTNLYHWFCIHPTKAQLNLIHHGYSINHIGSSQTSASMLTSHSNFHTFKIRTTENAYKVQGTGMWLNSLSFMSSLEQGSGVSHFPTTRDFALQPCFPKCAESGLATTPASPSRTPGHMSSGPTDTYTRGIMSWSWNCSALTLG